MTLDLHNIQKLTFGIELVESMLQLSAGESRTTIDLSLAVIALKLGAGRA